MKLNDICTREDVDKLIRVFYSRVRKHEILGPIFNRHITAEQWPGHEVVIADFWESSLFQRAIYKGNPMKAHLELDRKEGHTIEQAHFGHWLELWFSTIDELFVGEMATIAKNKARNMAHFLFMQIAGQRTL